MARALLRGMIAADGTLLAQTFFALLSKHKGNAHKLGELARLCEHLHTIAQGSETLAGDDPLAHGGKIAGLGGSCGL